MHVFLSKLAEAKLLKLNDYLIENWGLKARDKFVEKLNQKISQISSQPKSCPESKEIKGLYKCVITKQSTFYYRILVETKEIEIVTVFDTRQDPDSLKKDLK
ncbi:type II toxin-antitoxin system RelE/ParE family toxin [Flagellimonas marina]|uniref:Type II toxin-antitoxin system RelE/ParE family toxin n=1 Tax=Flagellimonas marina TaxID=1775168 RepID=A0ABV8PPA8_9FLAO